MNIIKNSNLVQAFKDPTLKVRPMDQYKAFLYLDVLLLVISVAGFLYFLFLYSVVQLPDEGLNNWLSAISALFLFSNLFRLNFSIVLFGFGLSAFNFIAYEIVYIPSMEYTVLWPEYLFTYENLTYALVTSSITLLFFFILTILYAPKNIGLISEYNPALYFIARKWTPLLIPISVIFSYLTLEAVLLSEAPYPNPPVGILLKYGGSIFSYVSVIFVVFIVFLASQYSSREPVKYRIVLVWGILSIVWFTFFRGERGGGAMGLSGIILIAVFSSHLSWYNKVIVLLVFSGTLYYTLEIVGASRGIIYKVGYLEGYRIGFNSKVLESGSGGEFDPMKVTLLPQSFAHLLHCIDLYHLGESLDGRSFTDLIPQSVPGFIAKSLGYKRPMSGPRILAYEYGRRHLGGLYIIGEGYWNFGLIGSLIVVSMILVPALLLENWSHKRPRIFLLGNLAYGGSVGFALFYGLQAFSKSLMFVLLFNWAFAKVYRWASKNALIDYYLDTLRRKKIAERRAEEAESLEGAPPEPAGSS